MPSPIETAMIEVPAPMDDYDKWRQRLGTPGLPPEETDALLAKVMGHSRFPWPEGTVCPPGRDYDEWVDSLFEEYLAGEAKKAAARAEKRLRKNTRVAPAPPRRHRL